MLAPELNAKTIGWQHNCYAGYLDVPNVVFWKQECLLQEYLPKLDRYIVLSDYDKPETVKMLLNFYHEQTQPLIDYYTRQGVLKTVDGTRDLNEVFQEIVDILGE